MEIAKAKLNQHLKLSSAYLAVAIAFFLPISTSIVDILFPLVVFLQLLIGNWRERFAYLRDHRVAQILLLFFALFILGLSYGPVPFSEAQVVLLKYSRYLLTIFLFPIFNDEKWRRYALNAFLVAVLLTLFLLYLAAFGFLTEAWYLGRASIFKSHIETNFLLAFSVYLLAQRCYQNTRYRFALTILLLLIIFHVLFLSTGRSGYVIFFVLLPLFLWQHYRWRGLGSALALVMILSASAFIFSPAFHLRMDCLWQILQQEQKSQRCGSASLRMSFIKNSWILIKQRPWLGAGTGSFRTLYASLVPEKDWQTNNPHSEFLNIAVQFGLFGIVLLLFVFYIPWRESILLPKARKELAQGVVLAIFVGSTFNSWLMDTTPGHFYGYFLAVAFAANYRRKGL